MNKTQAILATAYLGPVSYYCRLFAYPTILIDQHEHYLKQTYRSRCLIASPAGPQWLTIPIVHSDASHTSIRDIEISSHGNWQHLHWQALWTAYEGSPFFEYYADDLHSLYQKPFRFLFDFNEALRQTLCELIDLHPQVTYTHQYEPCPEYPDFRMLISPKNTQADPHFQAIPYYQTFSQKLGFLPNLSIVDLLFNMGPESLIVLRDCIQKAPWVNCNIAPKN